LRENDWAIILEEDTTLHDKIKESYTSKQLKDIIHELLCRISDHKHDNQGILYFGTCAPNCRYGTASLGTSCSSLCTHAYAVTKSKARTLFYEAYNCTSKTGPCNMDCDFFKCKSIDQAYMQLGERMKNNNVTSHSIIGFDLLSPDYVNFPNLNHYGIIYQPRSMDYDSILM
jgi:hypothetical protein